MHYYQFNIGDYAKSTMHLSMIEDLAYRRLLDLYYDTEKPLEPDVKKLCRLIRLSSHENETHQILSEFFNLTKKGWIQKRVQKELTAYSRKATAARDNGKKGGRPKKTQSVNLANPELTQSKAKQEPLNINHKPLSSSDKAKPKKRFTPPSIQEVKDYFIKLNSSDANSQAERFVNHYESNGWQVGKNKMKCWKAAVRNWMTRSNSYEANRSNNQQPRKLSYAEQSAANTERGLAILEAEESGIRNVGGNETFVLSQVASARG